MTEKTKNIVVTCVMAVFLFGLSMGAWGKEVDDFSDSERRKLNLFPEVSKEKVISGEFMTEFEDYTLDQFPFRNSFRKLNSNLSFSLFGHKDYHDIYVVDGYISKMEYPMKEESLHRAAERFGYIYEKYMKDTNTKAYFSIIPDKNYFLAEKNGYLSMDYEELFQVMKEKTKFMEYIDITKLLTIEDYYKTDTHWRQEKLIDVAGEIGRKMGVKINGEYEVKTLEQPFYGVYYGQLALSLPAEKINYLTNKTLEKCKVYDFENERNIAIYNMEKAYGKDSYEMFLSGSLALVTIENPYVSGNKELILFRDSFGSSIAPLFIEGYKKITLIDIRYLSPEHLERYVKFEHQDVLFLYSTLVLNHGATMK